MRLGLMGPAGDDLDALERAARFLLNELAVDQVVYLGVDGTLDQVILRWAEALVDGDPRDSALWSRAQRCLHASPASIDTFVARERERLALKVLCALPGDRSRVVELLDGKVVVMIHDKDDLDQEDMLPAAFLVFGSSPEPVMKQVGSRWFLAPGALDRFGVMVLEDGEEGVVLTLYDDLGHQSHRERLATPHLAKMKVEGAPR